MRRRIDKKVRTFLLALYDQARGSSSEAARIAGYKEFWIAGPRLRRKYGDLCERARQQWVEKAHVTYDEAVGLLGGIARREGHRDQVRALALIIELHAPSRGSDNAETRKEIMSLMKELKLKRIASGTPRTDEQPIEVEAVHLGGNGDTSS